MKNNAQPKNYVKAVVLSGIFGAFGVDRFYLGKTASGVFKLLTLGGFGIWTLVDFIITLVGAQRAVGSNEPLEDTEKYKPFFVKLFVIYLVAVSALVIVEILVFVLLAASNHSALTNTNDYLRPTNY